MPGKSQISIPDFPDGGEKRVRNLVRWSQVGKLKPSNLNIAYVTDGQSMFFYAGKDRETYKLGHIKIYSPTTQINQDVYDFVL